MQILDLPKSKLSLRSDELVKYGPGEAVVARFPTEHIVRIELEKSQEYTTAIILLAVFGALGFVSHQFVSSPGWSWAGVIACAGVCGFVLLGVEGRQLVVETTGGATRYPIVDLFEEAEGFVLSANALLGLASFAGSATQAGNREAPREEKDLTPTGQP